MLLLVTCVINNWQGIYIGFLDVATKVLAKIVQECLQIIADSILTESQRGFQKGHRYIDMRGQKRTMFPCLYCLWTWRRPMTRYMHNVPCGMCWRSVVSHQPMLHIIRSFHEGTHTYWSHSWHNYWQYCSHTGMYSNSSTIERILFSAMVAAN